MIAIIKLLLSAPFYTKNVSLLLMYTCVMTENDALALENEAILKATQVSVGIQGDPSSVLKSLLKTFGHFLFFQKNL